MSLELYCLPLDWSLVVNKGLLYFALVPVHNVWRLTDPDGFFGLSESLIILPVNYFFPLPIDNIVKKRQLFRENKVILMLDINTNVLYLAGLMFTVYTLPNLKKYPL